MTAPSTDVPPGGPGEFLYRLCRPMLPALGDWRSGAMAPSLYAFVLQVSRHQQVRLALLTLMLLPLSMLPLELQRRIVNDAVAHAELERLLAADIVRPILSHTVAAACLQPQVRGITIMVNSIYNGWRFEDAWLDR